MASFATTSESFKPGFAEKLPTLQQLTKPRLVGWIAQKENTTGLDGLQRLQQPFILPVLCSLVLINFFPEIKR